MLGAKPFRPPTPIKILKLRKIKPLVYYVHDATSGRLILVVLLPLHMHSNQSERELPICAITYLRILYLILSLKTKSAVRT